MAQDSNALLEDCRQKAEALVEEIQRYRSARDLSERATDALDAMAEALRTTIDQIRPYSGVRMRRVQLAVLSLLGFNALLLVAVVVSLVLQGVGGG